MMLAMHSPFAATPHSLLEAFTPGGAPSLHTLEDGSYILTVSAPGVKTSDLKVSVDGGVVKIEGETRTPAHTHFINWATRLPKDADVEQATVAHADGMLSLSMPKKAAAEPTRILVSASMAVEGEPSTDGDADDDAYTLTLPAPGIAPSDLEVVAKEGMLKVSGESKRTGSRLLKCYRLPRDADASAASATHVDGLLTVTIPSKPLAPLAGPTTLAINAAAGDAASFEMI